MKIHSLVGWGLTALLTQNRSYRAENSLVNFSHELSRSQMDKQMVVKTESAAAFGGTVVQEIIQSHIHTRITQEPVPYHQRNHSHKSLLNNTRTTLISLYVHVHTVYAHAFTNRDTEADGFCVISVDGEGKLLTDELTGLHRQTDKCSDTQTETDTHVYRHTDMCKSTFHARHDITCRTKICMFEKVKEV